MVPEHTLVTTVSRAMVRTVVGCLTGLALGVVVLGIAIGPGLWHDMALGRSDPRAGWEVGRTDATAAGLPARATRTRERVQRLSERQDCSPKGFGAGVIPASALVQVEGRVRTVSFDEGWAIHLGERPGRLLAVCRA